MTPAPDPSLESNCAKSQRKQTTRTKRLIACNYCRSKKIRCNGDGRNPCANCLDRGQTCVSSTHRRFRSKDQLHGSDDMAERLARIEMFLQQPPTLPSASTSGAPFIPESALPGTIQFNRTQDGIGSFSNASPHWPVGDTRDTQVPALPSTSLHSSDILAEKRRPQSLSFSTPSHVATKSSNTGGLTLSLVPQAASAPVYATPSSLSCGLDVEKTPFTFPCTDARANEGDSPDEARERSSIPSSETSNWEYHGPRSYLSICSKPGIQWVSKKTGSSGFSDSARKFTTYITRRLKIERGLSAVRKLDPDAETAWRYTSAYFDEALDAALGIVHRPWFEGQLKGYLVGAVKDTDPGWYALRNVIFASGCRIELSKSKSFREANQLAWGWFENALSVHTEILYFRTSIIGVQALTLMAYYSQNMGSPCLEYMLCANALQLAVAKGLHRQAVSSWDLNQPEIDQRSCIFWGAYCLEKQIVCQSGRPSTIDDDEISCQLPTTTSAGGSLNLEYCNILIRLAQLSSLAAKRLSSVRAFRTGVELLVESVAELDEQLTALKRSIEPILSFNFSLNPDRQPLRISPRQITYLQYAYFNTVLTIHTFLTCPWIWSLLGSTPHLALRTQVERSTHIVAETCRNAIVATEHIHFDASTPVPLIFFGPIYALINLFLYILQNPQNPRIQLDLALMDIGAGFFARLQFATDSELSVQFAKEMAVLAHKFSEKANRNDLGSENTNDVTITQRHSSETADCNVDRSHVEDYLQPFEMDAEYMHNYFDLELEHWSTFLPSSFDDDPLEFSNA